MADSTDKSAEKAYAEAASAVKPAKAAEPAKAPEAKAVETKAAEAKPAAKPVEAPKAAKPAAAPKPVKAAPKKRAVKAKAPAKAKANAPAKRAVKPAVKAAAKRAARVAKAAARPAPVKVSVTQPTLTELKDQIMTTKNTTDFTKPMADAFGEIQTRAKVAYEKGTEVVTEVTEFTKGNVEAFVESSKILAAGAQSLGKNYVEEAKSAYETLTADVKEMAAVKSPAELFQLQGKIARRNFDALVATSSKNTEAVIKLTNDAFAPLTGRVNVAAEKLAKVA